MKRTFLLYLLIASYAVIAQSSLIAHYPLAHSIKEIAGRYPDLLVNDPVYDYETGGSLKSFKRKDNYKYSLIRSPKDLRLKDLNEFTIELEFRTSSLPNQYSNASLRELGNELYFNPVLNLGYWHRDLSVYLLNDYRIAISGQSGNFTTAGKGKYELDKWQTIRVSYDLNNTVKVYLNGVLEITKYDVFFSSSGQMEILNTYVAQGNVYKGLWRNLKVYNRAAIRGEAPITTNAPPNLGQLATTKGGQYRVTGNESTNRTSETNGNSTRGSEVTDNDETLDRSKVGKYTAILFAVNSYQDDRLEDLTFPVGDAKKLKMALSNYVFDEIKLIENPTSDDIHIELDKLLASVKPSDNLLIFFAGHGIWDKQLNEGYWLLADSRHGNRGSYFGNNDLIKYLSGIKSQHSLVISDACFAGALFKFRNAFSDAGRSINKLYKDPSRNAMTSGNMSEVPDKSVFLDQLVKKLNANTDKYIDSETLYSQLKEYVLQNSPNTPQYGDIHNTGGAGGDFIFIRK